MGFLGVSFELDGRVVKLPPPPVSSSLELWQKLEIWYVSTHTNVVSESIPFSTKALLILLISEFFLQKNQHLRSVLEIF